jgi:hypothetical protein
MEGLLEIQGALRTMEERLRSPDYYCKLLEHLMKLADLVPLK